MKTSLLSRSRWLPILALAFSFAACGKSPAPDDAAGSLADRFGGQGAAAAIDDPLPPPELQQFNVHFKYERAVKVMAEQGGQAQFTLEARYTMLAALQETERGPAWPGYEPIGVTSPYHGQVIFTAELPPAPDMPVRESIAVDFRATFDGEDAFKLSWIGPEAWHSDGYRVDVQYNIQVPGEVKGPYEGAGALHAVPFAPLLPDTVLENHGRLLGVSRFLPRADPRPLAAGPAADYDEWIAALEWGRSPRSGALRDGLTGLRMHRQATGGWRITLDEVLESVELDVYQVVDRIQLEVEPTPATLVHQR